MWRITINPGLAHHCLNLTQACTPYRNKCFSTDVSGDYNLQQYIKQCSVDFERLMNVKHPSSVQTLRPQGQTHAESFSPAEWYWLVHNGPLIRNITDIDRLMTTLMNSVGSLKDTRPVPTYQLTLLSLSSTIIMPRRSVNSFLGRTASGREIDPFPPPYTAAEVSCNIR